MQPRSLYTMRHFNPCVIFTIRCRWHMHLVNLGYFDYGKTQRPPIWATCRVKMEQVLGSPLYVYGIKASHNISLQRGMSTLYLETNRNKTIQIICKLCSWSWCQKCNTSSCQKEQNSIFNYTGCRVQKAKLKVHCGKVGATILLMCTITNHFVVSHASTSSTAVWLVITTL